MRKQILKASLSLIASIFLSSTLFSDHHEEEAKTESLARGYTFDVKAGSKAAFKKAFAKHQQWRQDNGDPWSWNCYVAVNGPNVGRYGVRSSPHTWADFDAYDQHEFAKKANDHWDANVAPLLDSVSADISESKWNLGKWTDGRDYKFFQVNTSHLKIGQQWSHLNAIEQIGNALKEAEWEGDWSVDVELMGGAGETVSIIFPFENWAGMEAPSPNAYDVLVESLGAEKTDELFGQMNAAVAEQTISLYRLLPDLSFEVAK